MLHCTDSARYHVSGSLVPYVAGTLPRDVRVWPIRGLIAFQTDMGTSFRQKLRGYILPRLSYSERELRSRNINESHTWERALRKEWGIYMALKVQRSLLPCEVINHGRVARLSAGCWMRTIFRSAPYL